jgi:hypothetical protein
MGVVSLYCGRGEQSLGDFYAGLAEDDEHFTIYESLSYSLWLVNADSENALKFAERGLRVCHSERTAMQAEFDSAKHLYGSIAHTNASLAPAALHRAHILEQRFSAAQHEWKSFVDDLTNGLTNDYIYFSALELKNEDEARDSMTVLYNSKPQDCNLQDSLGFVLMRFAKNQAELDRAEQLFTSAVKCQDRETSRLASTHLAELRETREMLRGKK